MSLNINPTFLAQEFKATLEAALQQKGSRLRPLIMNSNTKGVKQAVAVERIGAIAATSIVGQLQSKVPVNATTHRRWVSPESKEAGPQPIDHLDQLQTLNDPTSTLLQGAIDALGRAQDDAIIAAALGSAKSGETGAATTAFDTNNTIAVNHQAAGNTGLTVAKLRRAKKLLLANEIDLGQDTPYCLITSTQHDDLLREAQVISGDYNDKLVLVNGEVDRYMGLKFIMTERLGVDGSGYRRNIVFTKSGLHLKMWEDIVTSVYQDLRYSGDPWMVYAMATFGAVRTDEKKVIEILCNEA